MNLVGICGKSGSGKSATAVILERDFGFAVVALADPIKRAAREFFNFTEAQCWGDQKDENDFRVGGLTPRRAFQQIGTEIARTLYTDVWIDYLMRVATFLLSGEEQTCSPPNIPTYYHWNGAMWLSVTERLTPATKDLPAGGGMWARGFKPDREHAKGVVVPDVRFQNEAEAIVKAGGRLWMCERSSSGLAGEAGAHASELGEIPSELITTYIDNNGTLEALKAQVQAAMLKRAP